MRRLWEGVIILWICVALSGCVGVLMDGLTEEARARRGPAAPCNWPLHGPRVPVVGGLADRTWRCQAHGEHMVQEP